MRNIDKYKWKEAVKKHVKEIEQAWRGKKSPVCMNVDDGIRAGYAGEV